MGETHFCTKVASPLTTTSAFNTISLNQAITSSTDTPGIYNLEWMLDSVGVMMALVVEVLVVGCVCVAVVVVVLEVGQMLDEVVVESVVVFRPQLHSVSVRITIIVVVNNRFIVSFLPSIIVPSKSDKCKGAFEILQRI